MTSNELVAAASGLGLGLSLIIAIGAQNALVLRQGLRREHTGPVVVLCAASDAVLIAAGAMTASAVWFTALDLGARLLRPLFARPAAWRVLDAGVAVVMTILAITLALGS